MNSCNELKVCITAARLWHISVFYLKLSSEKKFSNYSNFQSIPNLENFFIFFFLSNFIHLHLNIIYSVATMIFLVFLERFSPSGLDMSNPHHYQSLISIIAEKYETWYQQIKMVSDPFPVFQDCTLRLLVITFLLCTPGINKRYHFMISRWEQYLE